MLQYKVQFLKQAKFGIWYLDLGKVNIYLRPH